MQRKQFPIRLCFGMTSNKAQGQTLSRAGVYLPSEFFTHGQMYVALSRVGSSSAIRVAAPNGVSVSHQGVYADNIVYQEMV